ncbi:HAD family hydrolase [Paenibacillus macquariensis]|uniref:Hydrolase of the HAD superfamily n=1 Tax=Paenibacillus macquariensis TaxID=948756 RepID=A0ABY1JMV9_9BACL|nr:HAD-IA family hydrolase [Paenibacillus macquariensis]MEC0092283.1 HAD-IA family hydrolase [Paenibacillus macquariensis]OAB37174.1 HAD family hydrolase [Paenibacillus macquariensis subsp. macquariensis]SIQ47063.1 putative hydrolase of the HAD superfamily [Paenibacillus macquariensis]
MYKAIIFDLDNTLLNYSLSEVDSMKRTCNDHQLFIDDVMAWDVFWKDFSGYNFRYWMDYVNGGAITTMKDVLRCSFRDSLKLDESLHNKLSDTYWNYFCNTCYFEDGAEQILSILKDKYPLGIISNGLSEAQRKRLRAGNIDHVFTSLVISDEVGVRKPHKEIFDCALNDFRLNNNEVLFVGDSLQDDYQGALNSGIDFCYYNRHNMMLPEGIKPKYNISNLMDLIQVVGL